AVALPLADLPSVVQEVAVVELEAAVERAAVGVDQVPVVVAAAGYEEDALERAILQELEAVGLLVLARSAGRLAAYEGGIEAQVVALAELVELQCPVLQRRHLGGVGEIGELAVRVHLHLHAILAQRGDR